MTTQLKDIKITKIAICGEGANSEARIQLFKNKENDEMKFEELLKSLPEDQQKLIADEIEKVKKEATPAEQEKEDSDITEENFKQPAKKTKKAKSVEIEVEDEEKEEEDDMEKMLKSLPENVRSMFEKQQAKIDIAEKVAKQMLDEKETNIAKSKAELLKSLPGEMDSRINLFKTLNKIDSKIFGEVYKMLEDANALIEKSGAFDSVGSSSTDGPISADNIWAQIEKMAEPIAKSNNLSKAKAIEKVLEENPDLYKQYVNNLE